MKRELKDSCHGQSVAACPGDRKAHPDEKGTESDFLPGLGLKVAIIARPIPMKRELKDHISAASHRHDL